MTMGELTASIAHEVNQRSRELTIVSASDLPPPVRSAGVRRLRRIPLSRRSYITGFQALSQRSTRLRAQRVIQTLSGCTRVFWNDRISQSAPNFTRT
jgi:hypothetical protein